MIYDAIVICTTMREADRYKRDDVLAVTVRSVVSFGQGRGHSAKALYATPLARELSNYEEAVACLVPTVVAHADPSAPDRLDSATRVL